MVGTGVGASNGILIKTGEALQQAKEIDTVVLDKTGTITSGKLKVEEAGGYQSDFPMDAMMQIAAALEKKSEHPLAEAVVEWAEQFGLAIPEIVDFKATFGRILCRKTERHHRWLRQDNGTEPDGEKYSIGCQ